MNVSRLIVFLPGLGRSADDIDELHSRLQNEPGVGELGVRKFPSVSRWSELGRMDTRCQTLADAISASEPVEKADSIILVGHSVGGVMVRYAYLYARNEHMAWADKVERIVLLAAPNRGTKIDEFSWWIQKVVLAGSHLPIPFIGKDMLYGSLFISDLRIRWIRELTSLGAAAPVVVQVLGDKDEYVDADDSDDVKTLPKGVQLTLPGAAHEDILRTRDLGNREQEPGQRYRILRKAMLEDVDTTPGPVLEGKEAAAKAIVFALHGIRSSSGDWPTKLEKTLGKEMLVVIPSYGWMSAFNFALPFTRRENLRWFRDRYTYYFARHRDKDLHFVGHSNGTYLFGQTVKKLPAMEFGRVYLAGSVLPKEYDWRVPVDEKQIERVINVCANHDEPVGFLCRILRFFGMRDVGVGGFEGFGDFPDGCKQVRHLAGDHGAAFDSEKDLKIVAAYLRGDDDQVETYYDAQVSKSKSGKAKVAAQRFARRSRLAPYLSLLAVIALVALLVGLAAVTSAIIAGVVLLVLLLAVYIVLKAF
jgi:pimeloyl-ACP methyl ester carboxylesterase